MAKKPAGEEPSFITLERLPHGPHGLDREVVAADQRDRLMIAMVELVAAKGYQGAKISDVTALAHVSRKTFYQHFKGKQDFFLAVFDAAIEDLRTVAANAIPKDANWEGSVATAIAAGLNYLADRQSLARVVFQEAHAAGPEVEKRYRDWMQELAALVRAGRDAADPQLSERAEQSLLGGAASLITRTVNEGGGERLKALIPQLTQFVLTPYVGAEAARDAAAAPQR